MVPLTIQTLSTMKNLAKIQAGPPDKVEAIEFNTLRLALTVSFIESVLRAYQKVRLFIFRLLVLVRSLLSIADR